MTNRYPLLTKYVKAQACLSSQLKTMDDDANTLQRRLISQSIVKLGRNGSRAIIHPGETDGKIYYALQIRGCNQDHPTQNSLNDIEAEIQQAFSKAGVSGRPIACEWRADNWKIHEAERFDETVCFGGGEHQAPRLDEQRFKRTQGEALLLYQLPASEKLKLATVMQSIDALRKQSVIRQ